MLKEALDSLFARDKPATITDSEGTMFTSKPMHQLPHPKWAQPEALVVSTLAAVASYAKMCGIESPIVQVVGPTQVRVLDQLEETEQRRCELVAQAVIPKLELGWMDLETFLIVVASQVRPSPDRDNMLALLGRISDSNLRQQADDGVTQTVTVKRGVTFAENVAVPPRWHLHPYRTFPEIEQPGSDFILRLRKVGDTLQAALFEADGGAWRNQAIRRIRDWLEAKITSEDPYVVLA